MQASRAIGLGFVMTLGLTACGGSPDLDAGGGLVDDGTPDGGEEQPEPPTGFSFRGSVTAAVHAGDAWYVGGEFSGAQARPAKSLVALDLTGTDVVECDLGAGFDGPVLAVATAGDAIFVGGDFSEYQGEPVNALAKLDAATCELDTLFHPPGVTGFEGIVRALAVSGTSLYVGGELYGYRGEPTESQMLAKLDRATGAPDVAFAGTVGTLFSVGLVSARALAVVDDALFVGGSFDLRNEAGDFLRNFARFDAATGALTTPASEFGLEGFDSEILAMAVEGSALYVGGHFVEYRGAYLPPHLAKMDVETMEIDEAFQADLGGPVHALAASAGSVFVGGSFVSSGFGGESRAGLVKVDGQTGAPLSAFYPAAAGTPAVAGEGVFALSAAGGVLFVGGAFASADAAVNGFIALDDVTGAMVGSLLPERHDLGGFDEAVMALAASGDRVWAGGSFHGYGGRSAAFLVKVDDASLEIDEGFTPPGIRAFDGPIHSLLVADGALYVGGSFSSYRGIPDSARGIAKLDLATGEIDTKFSPPGSTTNGVDGTVHAMAAAGDALLVGGAFSAYRGEDARGLVKVSLATGVRDAVFSRSDVPIGFGGGGGTVRALAISGASVFVGGAFEMYLSPTATPAFCFGLAKLDLASGELDTAFAPAVGLDGGFSPADVRALLVTDAALYVGGAFHELGGATVDSIAKLSPVDGALDTTFSPPEANGFFGSVESLATLGSSLYVAGGMWGYRGVGGSTGGLAKLDLVSGELDPVFSASIDWRSADPACRVVVPHGDAVLVGGAFGYYDGSAWVSRAAILDTQTGALR